MLGRVRNLKNLSEQAGKAIGELGGGGGGGGGGAVG